MSELITIIGIVLGAAIVFWLLIWRNERSWDTPSPPITPTPKKETSEDLARCDRIIRYLNQVETQVQQSERVDKTEIREMLFKLKNRWTIIYRNNRPVYYTTGSPPPPHPKLLRAAADRNNLEIELIDRGIYLEYPD